MTGCCAVNCKNRTETKFRTFKFPADPIRCAKWIQNMRRDKFILSKGMRLCEVHSESSQFEQARVDGWKKLKPNAIPTLFDVPIPPPRIGPVPRRSLYKKTQWPATPISTFAPVFNEPCGDTAFLSDNPFHILTNGDFKSRPIIVSLAQHEGLFPAAIMILHDDIMAELNDRWIEVAPYLLDYNSSVVPNKRDDLSHLIKQFYFHNEKISVKNGDKLTQMMGDRHFSGDIGRAALLHAFYSFSDVYVAMFSYRGKNSVTKILSGADINFGASHTDDVCYIMNTPYLNPEETQSDRDMIKRYVDMFTSFAYTGKPDFGSDVNWRRQSPFGFFISRLNFLEIHSPYKFTSNYIYNYANMSFWNSLPIHEPGNGRFFK